MSYGDMLIEQAVRGRDGQGNRSHQPAGHRRRAAFDRRADGQRALPDELFLDHPRKPRILAPALFDRDYNTLCRSDSTPMHIGSLPGYLCAASRKRDPLDAWSRGDCVIPNHPYYGASHSPDIAIVMPVFFGGELVGFSANTAHHVDIGAATPACCHRHSGRLRRRHAAQRPKALQ